MNSGWERYLDVKSPKALYASFRFGDFILCYGKAGPGTEPKIRVQWSSGCSVASDGETHLDPAPMPTCASPGDGRVYKLKTR